MPNSPASSIAIEGGLISKTVARVPRQSGERGAQSKDGRWVTTERWVEPTVPIKRIPRTEGPFDPSTHAEETNQTAPSHRDAVKLDTSQKGWAVDLSE